jgi:DNA polymerase III epsilon subunit-like protein
MTVRSERRAIVFDTETTGLIDNSAIPLKQQPHIIELTAIKIDLDHCVQWAAAKEDKWPEGRDRLLAEAPVFTSLFRHPKLPEDTLKITGITQEMVNLAPQFASKVRDLQRFFLGATHLVGHNLSFDREMLANELRRLDMLTQFPWPPKHICTVEATETLDGFRLGLNDLHEKLTGARFSEHHRSEPDTRATARVFMELVRSGVIKP